eukprot:7710734-Pyramimonas_sp.AAC.1
MGAAPVRRRAAGPHSHDCWAAHRQRGAALERHRVAGPLPGATGAAPERRRVAGPLPNANGGGAPERHRVAETAHQQTGGGS